MVPAPLLQPIVSQPLLASHQAQQQTRKIDGGLDLKFDDSDYDAVSGDLIVSGNVIATYGLTLVKCSTLRINMLKKQGTASNGVTITDPEGHIKASLFNFDWGKKSGSAKDVVLQADNIHIEADEMFVRPDNWELLKAKASLSRVGLAPVSFAADSISIVPGKSGLARRVFFHIYGTRIGPFSRFSFQLRKRLKGLGLPSVKNKKGVGIGVSWEAAFAAGDHGAISSFFDVFPKREPGFGLEYGYSPLGPEASTAITPRSDLGERFGEAWFDNVSVRTPQEEQDEMLENRLTYAIGSFWNQGTTGRPVDSENVSKRFELTSEFGGRKFAKSAKDKDGNETKVGGVGTFASVRIQSIRDATASPFVSRLSTQTSILAPSFKLKKDIFTQLRLDTFGSASENGIYSWSRVQAGLIYAPTPKFRLGLGYAVGSGIGKQDFKFDGLVAGQEIVGRADFALGPLTFKFLNKYNIDTHEWYDREYEISVAAREFEPFIAYRKFPSETRFGVRFRIDNLRDRLTRRDQRR